MWTNQWGLLTNQAEGGIPKHTEWDAYAEQFDPTSSFIPCLNTPEHNNGWGQFTGFSAVLGYENPMPNQIYTYDENYQGVAPLDLQPLANMPYPWE